MAVGSTKLTQFTQCLQDHDIEITILNHRITPILRQMEATVSTSNRRWVLKWHDTESMHKEVHFLATELGIRNDAKSDVPVCAECGARNWMKIRPENDPKRLVLLCFGCCKTVDVTPTMEEAIHGH